MLREHDLAVASYMKAVREDPDNREAHVGLERARLRASDAHLAGGRRLMAVGRVQDALIELQLASELNPTNASAADELRRARLKLRDQIARADGAGTDLDTLLDRANRLPSDGLELPATLLAAEIAFGTAATTQTVYLTLARLANLSLVFDPDFQNAPAPQILLSGPTIVHALDEVARVTRTFYRVTAPATIVVAPDTPAKRREYDEQVVQQFVVRNADLKQAVEVLRVVTDARSISQITGTNTIVVRDTASRVRAMGLLLAAFDKASPEVVVEIEILEVDRGRMRDYGVQLASPGSTGLNGSVEVSGEGGVTLQGLRNLSQADVLITNLPALYYRLMKTDTQTRTLANPHVRITDGVAAVAEFGQRVPIPTMTLAPFAQGGINIQPTTAFNYENVGVNIAITPRTHPNDDVTLALDIDLSSLGPPGFEGLPTFGTRKVRTTIRLKDGETNILAGLIREDERTERQTIPGIGQIPVLGRLFGRTRQEAEQTDVVILLTPRIVRGLNLAEKDLRPVSIRDEGGSGAMPAPAFPRAPAPPSVVVPPAPGDGAGNRPESGAVPN
jgi:general secretion pathway protein D